MAQISHHFLQFSLDDNAKKGSALKFHHSGARFAGVWYHHTQPNGLDIDGELGCDLKKDTRHEGLVQMMFLFHVSKFSGCLAINFQGCIGDQVATCHEAHLPPLSHHTAKASGMVSVDLREFGAFVCWFFWGGKKTRFCRAFLAGKRYLPWHWAKKNPDIFVDDFCALLQLPKLIMTDF